jgi:serine/threonine-protein kinase
VRFDADRLAVTGEAQLVQRGVAGDPTTGAAHYSIAADGTLAYVSSAASSADRRLAWVDRSGSVDPLKLEPAAYGDPRLSPDGSRLALTIETSASRDIWLYTFATKAFMKLTFGGRNWTPLWSADGKTIFYVSITDAGTRTSLLRKPADGSADADVLAQIDGEAYLNAMTGQTATFAFRDPKHDSVATRFDLVALDTRAGGKPTTMVVPTPGSKFAGEVSPNGRLLAYQNDGDGLPQIYVRDLAGSGQWLVSGTGGEEPHWSPDGRELFYRYNDVLMGVPVDTRTGFQTTSAPMMIFKGAYNIRPVTMLSFSVASDARRFLMLRPAADDAHAAQLHMVLNWGDELTRRIPAR